MEILGKITGVTNANITNRIQEIEERISVVEDIIEDIDTTVKKTKNKKTKHKKLLFVSSKKFRTQ
jgi:phage shock protein A